MPPRKREESFGQELVIEDIQFEDQGKYECVGINDGSDVPLRKSFDLSVECKNKKMKDTDKITHEIVLLFI